jgi:hypothetical protein
LFRIETHNGVHCLIDHGPGTRDRFHESSRKTRIQEVEGKKKARDSEKVRRESDNHIAFGETRCLTAIQGTRTKTAI